MEGKTYTISEASRLLKVENHVLRYWEEELDLKVPRNELGHRLYGEEEMQMLYCIKELKKKGFQLKAVKEVLPDLVEKKMIDVHKLLSTQEELESQGIRDEEEEIRPRKDRERRGKHEDAARSAKVVAIRRQEDTAEAPDGEAAADRPFERKPSGPQEEAGSSLSVRQGGSIRRNEEKMQEFEAIMARIVGRALREQADELSDLMSDQVCDKMLQEMEEISAEREQREEERYRKLDETIRSVQQADREVAAAQVGGRRRSLFFRKNKRKI